MIKIKQKNRQTVCFLTVLLRPIWHRWQANIGDIAVMRFCFANAVQARSCIGPSTDGLEHVLVLSAVYVLTLQSAN